MDYFISYAAYVDTRVDLLNTVASNVDRDIKTFEDILKYEDDNEMRTIIYRRLDKYRTKWHDVNDTITQIKIQSNYIDHLNDNTQNEIANLAKLIIECK
jgi:prefoldin subunit 5